MRKVVIPNKKKTNEMVVGIAKKEISSLKLKDVYDYVLRL